MEASGCEPGAPQYIFVEVLIHVLPDSWLFRLDAT